MNYDITLINLIKKSITHFDALHDYLKINNLYQDCLNLSIKFDKINTILWLFKNNLANALDSDSQNNYPIHIASLYNQYEVIKFLVKHNANVDLIDQNNHTALYIACLQNNFETIFTLLNLGASTLIKPNKKFPSDILKENHNIHTSIMLKKYENEEIIASNFNIKPHRNLVY